MTLGIIFLVVAGMVGAFGLGMNAAHLAQIRRDVDALQERERFLRRLRDAEWGGPGEDDQW